MIAPVKEEVILHVAGEGGVYAILGQQHQGRWRFWREAGGGDSWMYDDDDVSTAPASNEPAPERGIDYRDSLDDVLKQINSCWPLLHPIQVHPSFASDIMRRVTSYLTDTHARSRGSVISKWQEICAVHGDEAGESALNLPGH